MSYLLEWLEFPEHLQGPGTPLGSGCVGMSQLSPPGEEDGVTGLLPGAHFLRASFPLVADLSLA